MARTALTLLIAALVLLSTSSPRAQAAGISEQLLPDTTKGYLSIPDYPLAQRQWNATQLGQLLEDPAMQPFIKDLTSQISGRRGSDAIQLGVELEELEAIASGEVAVATVQPGGQATAHAEVLIAQVQGNEQAATDLLQRIGDNLVRQEATRSTFQVGGVRITAYKLPRQRGQLEGEAAYHLLHEGVLVTTDHEALIRDIAQRLQTPATDGTLANVPAYQATMRETAEALGDYTAHARWFAEPFGLMEVGRASRGEDKKRGTDLLQVLRNQGFDAIEGVGGQVVLKTEDHELLHRSLIYAPAKGTPEGLTRAARMLQFPNTPAPGPQAFVPASVATYATWNWKMREAFEFSKTLVNELAGAREGEDLFEDIIGSIRDDVAGPRVDLRKELVQHLGERASFFTDYRQPITPESERLLVAVQLTDSKQVAEAIRKIMESDPDAKRHELGEFVVWEIVSEQAEEVEPIHIVGGGFGPFDEPEPFEEEEDPILPNMAITVAHGHLMIGSHLDYLSEVLQQPSGAQSLANAPDYQAVRKALETLGAEETSLRFFSRSDKTYEPTYKLLQGGKMPQSESILGKLLNRMMGPEDSDALRKQEIDGSQLPEFSKVEQYLGPAGLFVRSRDDGWLVSGAVLTK